MSTESKCPFHHAGNGRSNRDWWPKQLNLKPLQHASQSDPMGEGFDYAKEFESLDLAAVKRDLLALMTEARAVAAALGYDFGAVDIEGLRRAAPDHKPSILQDHEAGRPMEIDALVRAPLAFARHAGVATPVLDSIAAQAIALSGSAR